jgi:hypothetical protein
MLSRSKKIKTEIQKQKNTIRGGNATERMTHKYSMALRNQLLKELGKTTDSDESRMIRNLLARQAEEQKTWRFFQSKPKTNFKCVDCGGTKDRYGPVILPPHQRGTRFGRKLGGIEPYEYIKSKNDASFVTNGKRQRAVKNFFPWEKDIRGRRIPIMTNTLKRSGSASY